MLRKVIAASLCIGSLSASPAFADYSSDLTREGRRTDQLVATKGPVPVEDRLTSTFAGTFGTPAETKALVTSMRNGTRPGMRNGTMGYGEIHNALALSQAYAAERGIPATEALDQILAQRASGMGWGRIARENGFKLGPVVSRVRSGNERIERAAPQRVTRTERVERSARPERMEKPARAERVERVERVERPERPERVERHGKS